MKRKIFYLCTGIVFVGSLFIASNVLAATDGCENSGDTCSKGGKKGVCEVGFTNNGNTIELMCETNKKSGGNTSGAPATASTNECTGKEEGSFCANEKGFCENGTCNVIEDAKEDNCDGKVDGDDCTATGGQLGLCKNNVCEIFETMQGDASNYINGGGNSSVDGAVGGNSSAAAGSAKCQAPQFEEIAGVCYPAQTGLASTDVKSIITAVLYWLLGIFGVIAIIAFSISGIQYLVSAGSESMMETAKRNMVWSIVGVIVALSGLIIVRAIDTALRGATFF